MFKLILLFIVFTLFSASFIYLYIQTIPTFNFIRKLNFYEYLEDKFNNRYISKTGIDYNEVNINGKNYLVNFSGLYLKTDLKFLSPTSDKLTLYIPIFILHTGNTLLNSGDSLFTGLKIKKNFNGYEQYISGYSYIPIGSEIRNGRILNESIYLGYLYSYCSMTGTKWVDAYLYDRYLEWNISGNYKKEEQDPIYQYVCENDNTYSACPSGYYECTYWWCRNECYKRIGLFRIIYSSKVNFCSCINKGEYWLCNDIENNGCDAYNKGCIDYLTGTIDLNKTNCSLSGALGTDNIKKNFFLIR